MGLTVELLLPQSQDTSIRLRDGGTSPAAPIAPGPAGTSTGTQQPATGAAPPDPLGGCYGQLPILAAFGLIFYFLILRPQQKTEKARREMLSKVGKGDRVVTSGGIHGVIAGIADDTVQLRIDSEGKVKITVDRSVIARVLGDDAAKTALAAKNGKDGAKE